MCTVTYIPINGKVIFSSNRDEDPNRQMAIVPKDYEVNNRKIYYPKDPSGGGTWIGLNDKGTFAVLLNGGLVNHQKQQHYRHSRGLIVTKMLGDSCPLNYWRNCDLEGIEPFTLIIYLDNKLYQLLWTGIEKCCFETDPAKAHIWSSSTLYDLEAKKQRTELFNHFIQNEIKINRSSLFKFLTCSNKNDLQNGFIINRNELVKTCSISIIEMNNTSALFDYHDLITGTSNSISLNLLNIPWGKNPATQF